MLLFLVVYSNVCNIVFIIGIVKEFAFPLSLYLSRLAIMPSQPVR